MSSPSFPHLVRDSNVTRQALYIFSSTVNHPNSIYHLANPQHHHHIYSSSSFSRMESLCFFFVYGSRYTFQLHGVFLFQGGIPAGRHAACMSIVDTSQRSFGGGIILFSKVLYLYHYFLWFALSSWMALGAAKSAFVAYTSGLVGLPRRDDLRNDEVVGGRSRRVDRGWGRWGCLRPFWKPRIALF